MNEEALAHWELWRPPPPKKVFYGVLLCAFVGHYIEYTKTRGMGQHKIPLPLRTGVNLPTEQVIIQYIAR